MQRPTGTTSQEQDAPAVHVAGPKRCNSKKNDLCVIFILYYNVLTHVGFAAWYGKQLHTQQ
jgi:hypothetical protein